jgi:hypothetical protein
MRGIIIEEISYSKAIEPYVDGFIEEISYSKAIEPYVDGFREEISKSYNGKIELPLEEIKALLGSKFEKTHDTAVYWGLKSSLLHYDIIVDRERKENLIIMRFATLEDWKNLIETALGILMCQFPDHWRQFDNVADMVVTQHEMHELYFKMMDIIKDCV